MQFSRFSAVLVALAVPAVAQTNFRSSLVTDTNYGNYASQGAQIDFQSVAANTRVVPGVGLNVSARLAVGGVDTIVGFNHTARDVVSVDVSEQGAVSVPANQRSFAGGSTPSPRGGGPRPGPHSMLLRIGGRPGATGILEFWGTGVVARGVAIKYAYDVGNDGSVEFGFSPPASRSRILPVKIPAAGVLVIKITSAAEVRVPTGGSVRYKTGASVRFTPGPHCAIQPYGDGCGPRLAATTRQIAPNRAVFQLGYTNGSANAPGVVIFGLTFQRIPLPGTNCLLLTDPTVVAGFRTDRMGEARWALGYATPLDADVKIQAADFGGRRIHASNGLHVVCVQ